MVAFPLEIWLHIASFIPDEDLKKLYAVNRTFLDLALNAKYKELKVHWLNCPTIKQLKRLRDPYVARRVQKFYIGPTFIEQIVRLEKRQKSLIGRTLSGLGLMKKFSCCSTDQLRRTLIATMPHLQNIREYSLFWDPQVYDESLQCEEKTISHEVAISDDLRLRYLCELFALSTTDQTAQSYHYYFLGIDSSLTEADWRRRSIGRFFRSLPSQLSSRMTNLRSLSISLTSRGIWSDAPLFKGWNTASLFQLLSFVNAHTSTIESLSFCPPIYYDLTPLFAGLGHFPRLRCLRIDEPIDRAHMTDVSVLQRFIDSHRQTLTNLKLGPSLTCAFIEHELDMPWVPRVLTDVTPFSLQSLHLGLLHHTDMLYPVFEQLERFCTGLQSFRLFGKALHYDDVSSLAAALSSCHADAPVPLRDLYICIDDLDKRMVDLLAEQFPLLRKLSLCIDSNCTAIRTGMFAGRMRGVRYPDWRLTDISVEIEKGRTPRLDHSIMEILAIAVPSIKRFKGNEIRARKLNGSEYTTFELAK